MMMKKTLALTLTVLTLCMVLSGCSNSAPVSSSAKETGSKLVAGVLEQNSVEESSRKHFVQAKVDREVVRKQIEYKAFSSLNTMLMELKAGRVDYLQLPSSVGNYLAASNNKLIVETRENSLQHYHMAARADDTALIGEINNAIHALKADGTLDKLAADYITNTHGAPTANALVKHEDAKTYVVAVTGDLPPLDYVSADGTPAGFNVALLNAISEKTGCNFNIVQMDAAARLSALESRKIDLIFWIGCFSSEGFEPKTDDVCLSTPYFEESICSVGHSADILDKAMSIYQKAN
ncbi:MAG: transporter substrate-binding domain-containing protein [Syntrophomonas sp.]